MVATDGEIGMGRDKQTVLCNTRFPPGKCLGEWRKTEIHVWTAWANKMYLVVVKTMFLSRAREVGGGEAPSGGRFAFSPSSRRTVKKW